MMSKFSTQKQGGAKGEKADEPKTELAPVDGETEQPPIGQAQRIAAVIESLPEVELNALLKTVRGEVRRRENEREALRPHVGSLVRILHGRPKYVGREGTAIIVGKSRCWVQVPDVKRPAYLLIRDVELVKQ
jgi:hypothetical protein